MGKPKTWFKKLTPPQLKFFGIIGGAVITAISIIIVALINKCEVPPVPPPVPPPAPPPIITSQNPKVERLNAEISDYLKKIDNIPESDTNQRQDLLNTVFELLDKSIEADSDDGETYFLYAEAYLRDKNYDNAFTNYGKALENKYPHECDVHFGYGYIYEALGDRDLSNFDFSRADIHYSESIKYFNRATTDKKLSFHQNNVDKAKEIVSRVEGKKIICEYNEIMNKAFSPEINIITDYDAYSDMEELAISFNNLSLWKNATLCYYWLFRQTDIGGQRREKNTGSLELMSEFWEFSDDFIHDITNNSVIAIINSNNVNFRKDHIIVDDNIIRQFSLYEELQVLARSDFRQSIGNVNAYWYKVRAEDGIEGWVYGLYLFFYPIFPFQ